MTPTNEQIAKLFEDMGSLLEMKGDTVFKVRAYQRAARAIEQLSSPLAQSIDNREDLTKIPGIGKAISEKISEFIVTGQIAAYQKLLEELPAGVLQLKDIPGIGPKTAMAIGRELGISTVEEVAEAAADGRLASLPRMGQKVADGILRHIRALQALGQRTPIGQALPIAEEMIAALREQCPDIGFLFPAGSLRRWEDTIGDVDLIGTALDPEIVADSMVKLPMVIDALVHGPTKTRVIVESGSEITLHICQQESFGHLLQYFL